MTFFRSRALVLLTTLALGVASPLPAHASGAAIRSVHYDAQREMLIISADGELHPRVTHLDHPDRLVIDLPGTHLAENYKPIAGIVGTPISRIRVGQYLATTTRVVLDLAHGADYQAVASGNDVLVPIHGGHVTPQAVGKSPATATSDATSAANVPGPAAGSPQLQAVLYHQGDLTFALSRLTPYWTHIVPGSPFRYIVVFPRTRLSPDLLGEGHEVNAGGILRWRASQAGQDARVEFDLSKAPRFEVVPGPGTWHFYTERPHPASKPSVKPTLVVKPSAKPTVAAAASAKPTQTTGKGGLPAGWPGAPDAPLALRKIGDQWQLLLTADGRLAYKTTAIGDDRLRIDIAGGHVALPRDSVYIDNGLIARVRVNPGAAGNTRLTIDLDQPVRHAARLLGNQKSLLIILSRLGNRRVTVDPGHGGTDTGTIGQKGIREKDVTLAIATKLAAVMKANGISVQMTRMKDLEVLLRPRVEMANHNDSDVFISIHANSFGSQHGVEGIESYYFSDESYPLAKAIHRQLLLQLKQPDRGVRKNNFYVVHHTQMPSVLVEIGYLSNAHEESLLSSPAYQDKAAHAIYAGIKDFLADRKKKP
jgi:N-acetylmuramoyl-L-alanine amidase CwlD